MPVFKFSMNSQPRVNIVEEANPQEYFIFMTQLHF